MGRPKLGNVLYRRRVHPGFIPLMDGYLERLGSGVGADLDRASGAEERAAMTQPCVPELVSQNKALLEDVQGLSLKIAEFEGLLEQARSEGLDEKGAYWKAKYFELQKQVADKYSDS